MKRLLFLSAALLACIGMQSCNDDEIDPNARYDVHTVSNLCEGIYFGDAYLPNDAVYTHYLMISDKPIPESGWMDPEGTYYILRFNAPFENFPPEGTYTTTPVTDAYSEYTLLTNKLSYVTYCSKQHYIESGTMVVRRSGGAYDIELTMKSDEGTLFHTVYKGDYTSIDKSIEWLPGDLDTQMTAANAWYLKDGAEGANLNITLYENLDESGWLVAPSSVLIMVGHADFDDEGKIVPGSFTISGDMGGGVGNYFEQGACVNFLNAPFPTGTNIKYYYDATNSSAIQVGLAESGKVDIVESGTGYTVNYEFVTDKGKKVTGRYTGPLKVKDAPKVVEKHDWDLEEDHVLKFDATNFRATAFSDKYTVENALVWKIQLQQYDGNWSYDSDQLIIQIVCAPGNEAEPVPGTYRVSEGNEVGTVIAGTYYGTFGIGSFFQHYEAGSIASAGAAVDGSMTLTKNADGTWTIDFDFLDGQAEPKHFSGSWTGTLG